MMNKRKVSHESGLTLVEVLASLVILGILIVSFLSIFGQSALHNKKTDDLITNTNYAEYLMELFVSYSQKGSSIESVSNLLVNDERFKKKLNLEYSKETTEGIIEVHFDEIDQLDGYRGTRVIINTYSTSSTQPNSVIESLLYWRTNYE
ncbi:prepilin-type N-terminal cleavage/methylation domain-containing protein [Sporosarcina sp. D27]|uniref:type IV pilus modification PilV family protein n=1 Tax=Sporosarcina sp. D27 TaxID=1382305 RepID=UPI000472BE2B|nr:type II secretion system protein [Sporosarcina sp. D27]